ERALDLVRDLDAKAALLFLGDRVEDLLVEGLARGAAADQLGDRAVADRLVQRRDRAAHGRRPCWRTARRGGELPRGGLSVAGCHGLKTALRNDPNRRPDVSQTPA